MAEAPPYLELGDLNNYLAADVRELLLNSHEGLDETALVPTRDQIAVGALTTTAKVLREKAVESLDEVFDIAGELTRGGAQIIGPLSHVGRFAGRRTVYMSVKAYGGDGLENSRRLEIGQLPSRSQIEGKRMLLGDEVCDSGGSMEAAVKILTTGLDREEALERISDSTFIGMSRRAGRRLLDAVINGLGAESVETAVIDYKPTLSKTGFVPDYHAYETDRWVVYPDEVYELLGLAVIKKQLWLPQAARTELGR